MGQACCKQWTSSDIAEYQYKMQDFKLVKCVGRGGFGRVWNVVHKKTKKVYALKVMKKLLILNKNGHKSVMNERNILAGLDYEYE
jgi:serine/threonine protein kinase